MQGWEPWNDFSGFNIRDGMLLARASGDDPYMASPEIDIVAMEIGNVEVTMRVITAQPTIEGRVYWHASSSQDFEPGLFQTFAVRADGEFHTYRVDMAKSPLYIGDRILRLRLDPADTAADISIRMIRINVLCRNEQDNSCGCTPQ